MKQTKTLLNTAFNGDKQDFEGGEAQQFVWLQSISTTFNSPVWHCCINLNGFALSLFWLHTEYLITF